MVFHEADRVVATHDIHGLFRGDIRQGTAGVVVSHCGSDMPTYGCVSPSRPAGQRSSVTSPNWTSRSAKRSRQGDAATPNVTLLLPICAPSSDNKRFDRERKLRVTC